MIQSNNFKLPTGVLFIVADLTVEYEKTPKIKLFTLFLNLEFSILFGNTTSLIEIL